MALFVKKLFLRQALCVLCPLTILFLPGCASLSNSTFRSLPLEVHLNGPDLSEPVLEKKIEPVYTLSGHLTAVSSAGVVSAKAVVVHGKNAERITLYDTEGRITQEAVIADGEIILRRANSQEIYRDSLGAWMHTHFGASITPPVALAWLHGTPFDPQSIVSLDKSSERWCFSERGWLVCIRKPSPDRHDLARIVQISLPSVNVSFSVAQSS